MIYLDNGPVAKSRVFQNVMQAQQVRIPTQGEKRERDLRELVRKNKRPVALFVDEAHAEIKALFSNALDPVRAATLRDRMLAAGLPI